jgi:hypothetical protein
MNHRVLPEFWWHYRQLPPEVQAVADRGYETLRQNPRHPSLRLKRVGDYWSVRVGRSHRALAVEDAGELVWVWIGLHDEYLRIIGGEHA